MGYGLYQRFTVKEAMGNVPAGCKKVKVTIGISDGNYVQILSGQEGTEKLYIQRGSSLQSSSKYFRMFNRALGNGSKNRGANSNYGNKGMGGGMRTN